MIRILRQARAHLRVWHMRLNDRAFLASLQAVELHALGLTPAERDREIGKAPWEA
jgi:uncharacterized protein YjiS (DUF1127 family)